MTEETTAINGAPISGSVDEEKVKITRNNPKAQADANKSGLMQKIFGYGTDAKYGISGIVILGIFIIGFIFTTVICVDFWFFNEISSASLVKETKVATTCIDICEQSSKISASLSEELKNVWAILTPILTLVLGYIFGRK